MKTKLFLYLVLPLCALFTACTNMEQDIEILLPEHAPQMVVECYLIPGRPYRLTLTESASYFDTPQLKDVTDAEVYIIYKGKRTKLNYRPMYSRNMRKYYTHTSTEVMSGKPGDTYELEITDNQGRKVTGFTRILPVVEIESVEWKFNDRDKAYLLASFQDDVNATNYYRYVNHLDSLGTKPERDFTATDNLTNGKLTSYGSAYTFDRDDTVIVSLYNIEKQYYDFLNTVNIAKDANRNPFGQPSKIRSSVQGGIGIFTNLAFQRKTVVLQ